MVWPWPLIYHCFVLPALANSLGSFAADPRPPKAGVPNGCQPCWSQAPGRSRGTFPLASTAVGATPQHRACPDRGRRGRSSKASARGHHDRRPANDRDQTPPDRGLRRRAEMSFSSSRRAQDDARVGAQGCKPVDDPASGARVGGVSQQTPSRIRLAQKQQRDRQVRPPSCKPFLTVRHVVGRLL